MARSMQMDGKILSINCQIMFSIYFIADIVRDVSSQLAVLCTFCICYKLIILLMIGLRESLGILMKLLLPMLLRNQFHPSLHLLLSVTKRGILLIRILVAGKDKETGRRTGGKPMLERGNLRCLLSV